MKIQYFGDRIEITGNEKELSAIDWGNHGQEATITVQNDWGGCFALAANLKADGHDVEIINEDAEPVKVKKPHRKDTDSTSNEVKKSRMTKAQKLEIQSRKAQGESDFNIADALKLDIRRVQRIKGETDENQG